MGGSSRERAPAGEAGIIPDRRALPPALRWIEEQHPFQRRSWRVERAGWLGMVLLILAGTLGLLGGAGWLAEAEATTPDGALHLRYDRSQRLGAPTRFLLELRAPPGGRAELRLGPGFLARWSLEGVAPQPVATSTGPEGMRLAFQAAPGAAVLPVVLRAQPVGGFGRVRAELAAGQGPALSLPVLVWP